MYLLTYERKRDNHLVKLVFDSRREAESWGLTYRIRNEAISYKVEQK